MDVAVLCERLQQPGVARKVSHDPELDLGVVRGNEHRARRRNECLPDTPAFRRADGDVLQIWTG